MQIRNITIDNNQPLTLIAGPCVIETYERTRTIARYLSALCAKLKLKLIFKASYDKANRSSIHAKRGIGIHKGILVLERIKHEFKLPVITDVHNASEVEKAASICDIIQVPAFLCRQTDLLVAAGNTGKPVNIKKGQFVAPEDIIQAVKKVYSTGNKQVLVTERGFCFGYNNLVVDMRALAIIKKLGIPVVFDATHSVQLPGGRGGHSGGQRQFVETLARSAVAVGIAALFCEVHPHPCAAFSDGPNSLDFKHIEKMLKKIILIDRLVKQNKFK
ncbi:MAG: 3-deoxy-8-phosphooctulonate synthase [bacterium]